MWSILAICVTASLGANCTNEKIFARAVTDECGANTASATLDWSAFTGEVFEARSLVFLSGAQAAATQLKGLLALAAQSFALISQCPAAVATTSYALAEVLDVPWQQLALLQLALAVYPDQAHGECTQWPLRGRDLVSGFRQLSRRLFPPNAGREERFRTFASGVAVVSACAGVHPASVRRQAELNLKRYGQRHGYDPHFFAEARDVVSALHHFNLTTSNAPAFWRAYAIQAVLKMRSYSWIMWVDCEVLITDPELDVDVILSRYGRDAWLVLTANGYGVQPDMMLFEAGDWSQSFLQNWTTVPFDFLHGATRIPAEWRHPERVALQHATLPHWPHWGAWGSIDWESYSWNKHIALATDLPWSRR